MEAPKQANIFSTRYTSRLQQSFVIPRKPTRDGLWLISNKSIRRSHNCWRTLEIIVSCREKSVIFFKRLSSKSVKILNYRITPILLYLLCINSIQNCNVNFLLFPFHIPIFINCQQTFLAVFFFFPFSQLLHVFPSYALFFSF